VPRRAMTGVMPPSAQPTRPPWWVLGALWPRRPARTIRPHPGCLTRPGPAARVVQEGALLGADRLAGGVQGDDPLQPGAGGQGWGHEADPGDGLVVAEGRYLDRGPAGQLDPDGGRVLVGQPRHQQAGAGQPRQAVHLRVDAAVPDGPRLHLFPVPCRRGRGAREAHHEPGAGRCPQLDRPLDPGLPGGRAAAALAQQHPGVGRAQGVADRPYGAHDPAHDPQHLLDAGGVAWGGSAGHQQHPPGGPCAGWRLLGRRRQRPAGVGPDRPGNHVGADRTPAEGVAAGAAKAQLVQPAVGPPARPRCRSTM
jgi:hypothetical protein